MKDLAHQLFVTLTPLLVCLTVSACSQCIHGDGSTSGDQTVGLVPKDSSFDMGRISMLTVQKDRYSAALQLYRSADGKKPESIIALNALLTARHEYDFVAQETADSAFRVSGLPRALPRP